MGILSGPSATFALDLEGIVAKHASSPYGLVNKRSPRVKIRTPAYSQMPGRREWFDDQARRSTRATAGGCLVVFRHELGDTERDGKSQNFQRCHRRGVS